MNILKDKLTTDKSLKCAVGLRNATNQEVKDIKSWLKLEGIPYFHKYQGLLFNGVLHINFKCNSRIG